MSRRVSAIDDTPSLFPFLAVLICTVGALVVLLVVMIRQSRVDADADVQAAQRVEAEQAEAVQQARWEEEDWKWKTTILQAERQQRADDLAKKRSELSHIEDHLRRVDQEADQLIRAVEKLKLSQGERESNAASIQAEIDTLNLEIEKTEAKSAKVREELKQRQRAYAIVPYTGPNGTHRHPIFVECLADRIILQPTGVVLLSADFEPPLDVDNPLAAAIRATSEYLAKIGSSQDVPYPLLLVRPDGAESYAAARYALRSWETDFGYELIPADMKLSYPQPDTRLAALQERVILELRERRLAMQKAIPNQNARRYGLRASRNGGFVPVNPDDSVVQSTNRNRRNAENGGGTGQQRERTAASFASGSGARNVPRTVSDSTVSDSVVRHDVAPNGDGQQGSGKGYSTDSRDGFSTTPGGGSGGNGNSRGATGNRASPVLAKGGKDGPGSDTLAENSTSNEPDQSQGNIGVGNTRSRKTGYENVAPANLGSGDGASAETGLTNAAAGGPSSTTGDSNRSAKGGQVSEAGGRAGSASTANSSATRNGSSASDSHSEAISTGGSSPGSLAAGTSGTSGPSLGMPGATPQMDRDQQTPTANISAVYQPMPSATGTQKRKSRQKDWGLPSSAAGAIPIARPLHARLEAGRLELLPDGRSKFSGQDFSLEHGVDRIVDPLVTSVWQQIKGWGMAGSGVYWKPTLHVEVAPGAEAVYQDLENILQDSGIAVKKSGIGGKKVDR